MTLAQVAALVLAGLSVGVRALLAAAETGLGALSLPEPPRAGEREAPEDARVAKLKADPDGTLAALRALQLLTVGVAATATAWVVVPRLEARILGPQAGHTPGVTLALLLAVVAAVVGVVYLVGDVVPRAAAAAHPVASGRRLLWVAAAARAVMRVPVGLARVLADAVLKPFGGSARRLSATPSLDELERHLASHVAGGRLAPQTGEIIHQVLTLEETTAKEVMVPRTQVVALEVGASPGEVVETLSGKGHTRLPVYRDEIDNIVGLVNAKDVLPLVARGEAVELLKVMRPATFVPWSKPIGPLMREMQAKHAHLAMVLDEFGGFMGIITLEDILEEIVGEIEDEFDRPAAADVEALPDGSFLVRGSMNVEDFNLTFTANVPEDDEFETLAGFLNLLAGAIPATGDTFFHEGLQLTVAKRSERRVRQVRVRRVRPVRSPEAAG